MDAVLVIFIMLVIGCTWGGIKLVARAMRATKPPPIPPARMANPEGKEAAYATAASVGSGLQTKLSKGLLAALGVGLIALPWTLVYLVFATGFGSMKGRVLRIRNRAQLPELATGEGWSAQPVALEIDLSPRERAALGEHWLDAARMEHASVAAFSQLSLHLSALGAPARLLVATHRAALEEIVHAEQCFTIATAITGVLHTAGPIVALRGGGGSAIDLTRVAVDSLVDGCLGEGIAADEARYCEAAAREPAIRATLAMIARDEARHAELAWDVLAWCLATGDEAVRTVIATRTERLAAQARPRLAGALGAIDERALVEFGVIDHDTFGKLAAARIAAVQERARLLIGMQTAAARRAA